MSEFFKYYANKEEAEGAIIEYPFYGYINETDQHLFPLNGMRGYVFDGVVSAPIITYYSETEIIPTHSDVVSHTYENGVGQWALNSPEIPYSLFQSQESITRIILSHIWNIRAGVFTGCSSLDSITIPRSVTHIEHAVFVGCDSLSKTNYTGDIAGWCAIEFAHVEANPIYYSHNLYIDDQEIKDLVIPDSVDTITDCAFPTCALTSVIVGDSVLHIGKQAFSGCSNLALVKIGNNVTSIERDAFRRCYSLSSVILPPSVTHIGSWAFYDCTSLRDVTCGAVIPPTLASNDTFHNVKAIYVPAESVEDYKIATNWSQYADVIQPIPNEE